MSDLAKDRKIHVSASVLSLFDMLFWLKYTKTKQKKGQASHRHVYLKKGGNSMAFSKMFQNILL